MTAFRTARPPFDAGALDAAPHDGRVTIRGWDGDLELAAGATHYGYCGDGTCEARSADLSVRLRAGQYFALPGEVTLRGGGGFVVSIAGFAGLPTVGGPIEGTGRLRYIDGCTDTLLLGPARRGDPCLNALYFPPGTDQTPHTHPSLRAGWVVSGRGECVVGGTDEEPTLTPLRPGAAFLIPPDIRHAFRTGPGETLTVVAFHPDTDTGPTDEDHPMLNRTILAPADRGR